jgi:hypothetical protein
MTEVMTRNGRRQEGPDSGDYFVVSTADGWYYVDYATAARLSRQLDRRWTPAWVKFVDLSGSRVWLRSRIVESIRESTGRFRAADREFHYRRRKEDRDDRRWDDDE